MELNSAITLLGQINREFLLLHIHGNNIAKKYISGGMVKGKMPSLIEVTFVNKKLVQNFKVSTNQNHPTKLDSPNYKFREENAFQIIF